MTYSVPLPWTGRFWTIGAITPCTVNALTGVVTRGGTTYDIAATAMVEGIKLTETVRGENIKAANAVMDNYQPIADDFEVEVSEIKGSSGSGLVLNGWVGTDHFIVEVGASPDGGTHNYLVQMVCQRAGLDDEYIEGKSVMVLRGKACGLPIAYIPLTSGTPTKVY